jgi:acyl-coenzyme A thioesterase PaaI-like protein
MPSALATNLTSLTTNTSAHAERLVLARSRRHCQPDHLVTPEDFVNHPSHYNMAPTREQLGTFAPLTWATPYFTSPDWVVLERSRGANPSTDLFCRLAMQSNDGVSEWLELFQKPVLGEKVQKTVSLIKFGNGLNGYPGICHGGATLALMDEGLAYAMVAYQIGDDDSHLTDLYSEMWKAIEQGTSVAEVLKGMYVTAKLDIRFLRPVLVPGLVGIETEVLEIKGPQMKIRGVMKDAKGTPLMQADGLWVKIGGKAKL